MTGTEWVLPYRLERQLDPASPARERTSTPVGTIGSSRSATVDQRGLVTPTAGGWSLDWWIGADDRWHLPSREVAVRQRLIDDTPVVETSMRVPTGDAVQRVFAVRDGVDEVVIVEIENRSKLPFAVALSVRPYDADGSGTVERIELRGESVHVDRSLAMLLARAPSRVAASTSRDGDVASIVMSGAAGESMPSVRDRGGKASAAFIFPLSHTATMRVALPLGKSAGTVPTTSAEQVARGWTAHTDRGMRLELPDSQLRSRLAVERAFLLLRLDDLGTLDRYGYEREVAEILRRYPDARRVDGAALHAIAEHWRLHRDRDLVGELAPWIAHAAERVGRKGGDGRALLDAAELLAAAGEPVAAADATRMASRAVVVAATVGDGLLSSIRAQLVLETTDGLALCSEVPESWLGQGIEVHDAPTHRGQLSYAIRWHGDRPALLWELVPHDGVDACRFSVPGLDPSWSSADLSGDALLAPVAPPGQVSAVSLRRP